MIIGPLLRRRMRRRIQERHLSTVHINDGILSPQVCLATGILAAAAVGYSLRQLQRTNASRSVPLTGMFASLIFAGQMVNFPLFGLPVSGHLMGGVLAGIVLGPWAGCVAMAAVLFIQMALFADGGWLAYGANVLNMAVVGSWGGAAVWSLTGGDMRSWREPNTLRDDQSGEDESFQRNTAICWSVRTRAIAVAAIAAWLSVVAGSSLFCIEFAASHATGDIHVDRLWFYMIVFHAVIGLVEATITAMVLNVILKRRPEILFSRQPEPGTAAAMRRWTFGTATAALAVAAFMAPFASGYSDGLEAAIERVNVANTAEPRSLWLQDYALPMTWLVADAESSRFWQAVSVSAAGVCGSILVATCVIVFLLMLRAKTAFQPLSVTAVPSAMESPHLPDTPSAGSKPAGGVNGDSR